MIGFYAVLPAIGDILTYYGPPLVIARLLGRFARSESLTAADHGRAARQRPGVLSEQHP
jgi:hypothetical protein